MCQKKRLMNNERFRPAVQIICYDKLDTLLTYSWTLSQTVQCRIQLIPGQHNWAWVLDMIQFGWRIHQSGLVTFHARVWGQYTSVLTLILPMPILAWFIQPLPSYLTWESWHTLSLAAPLPAFPVNPLASAHEHVRIDQTTYVTKRHIQVLM